MNVVTLTNLIQLSCVHLNDTNTFPKEEEKSLSHQEKIKAWLRRLVGNGRGDWTAFLGETRKRDTLVLLTTEL